jgi:hypothetical protein
VTTADGELAKRDVKLGLRSVDRTEVLEGIAEGDRVVISPVGALAAGRRVAVRSIEPTDAISATKQAPQPEGQSFKGIR